LSLHTVHTLSFDVAKFKLTRVVTYRQYLFSCGFTVFGDATPLIPPDFPHIFVESRIACCEKHKVHRDCVKVSDGKNSVFAYTASSETLPKPFLLSSTERNGTSALDVRNLYFSTRLVALMLSLNVSDSWLVIQNYFFQNTERLS
jgi:hypothetical protein